MCCYFLWFYDFHLSPRILVSLAGLEIDRDTVWHLHCVCNEALTINFMNWMSYQPSLCFWRSLHGLETSFHRVGNSTSTSPSTLLNVLRLLPFTFIPISPFSIFQPLSTYRASLLSFTPLSVLFLNQIFTHTFHLLPCSAHFPRASWRLRMSHAALRSRLGAAAFDVHWTLLLRAQ